MALLAVAACMGPREQRIMEEAQALADDALCKKAGAEISGYAEAPEYIECRLRFKNMRDQQTRQIHPAFGIDAIITWF